MGQLYEMRQKIDRVIEERKLDPPTVRGQLTLLSGFLLTIVSPSSPDDATKIEKLKKAAKTVLQIDL